ncbi:uncharacterized [Tachysurus ichikawai]
MEGWGYDPILLTARCFGHHIKRRLTWCLFSNSPIMNDIYLSKAQSKPTRYPTMTPANTSGPVCTF